MKKTVNVVGAIIENTHGEILCALRAKDMTLPNLWEFPGGKIEINESISEAIVREIKEELNTNIEFINVFHDYTHEYDNVIVNLVTCRCKLLSGEPKAYEHAKLIWMPKDYLNTLLWAPADIPSVELLINEKCQ